MIDRIGRERDVQAARSRKRGASKPTDRQRDQDRESIIELSSNRLMINKVAWKYVKRQIRFLLSRINFRFFLILEEDGSEFPEE